jgi:hypothetical protein
MSAEAFEVLRHGKVVDTVWFTGYTVAEARTSLINHDGYPIDIHVRKAPARKQPARNELERRPLNPSREILMRNFVSNTGAADLCMTLAQAQSAAHPGPCDTDVETLAADPAIRAQLDALDPAAVAAELKPYGAWDAVQLANHPENLLRLLWLAAGDIVEENRARGRVR